MILQILMAGLGTAGFALIFHMRKRFLPVVAVGGMLVWGVYLLMVLAYPGKVFLPSLIAGGAGALYAEMLARVCKAPSTPFFQTSVIALIPGRALYKAVNAVVKGEFADAGSYGTDAFACALGIALGMGIAWTICDLSRKVRKTTNR